MDQPQMRQKDITKQMTKKIAFFIAHKKKQFTNLKISHFDSCCSSVFAYSKKTNCQTLSTPSPFLPIVTGKTFKLK